MNTAYGIVYWIAYWIILPPIAYLPLLAPTVDNRKSIDVRRGIWGSTSGPIRDMLTGWLSLCSHFVCMNNASVTIRSQEDATAHSGRTGTARQGDD